MCGGNISGLISIVRNVDTSKEDKLKVLAEIQLKPGRKLGPALAEKIYTYLS